MPNIKSAIKRVKVNATKNLRNRRVKSATKTSIKKFEASLKTDVTAATALLAKALKMKGADAFLASLPVGGEDGSMAKRLGNGAKGRVLAKTGYIAGVSCLSGYVLDKDGKPAYAFSVLVNKTVDLTGARTLQDDVCGELVNTLK